MSPQPASRDDLDRRAAEAWFDRNGLPWFVAAEHDRVDAVLRARRWPVLAGLVALGAAAGLGMVAATRHLEGATGRLSTDDEISGAAAVCVTVVAVGVLVWAWLRLRLTPVLRWATAQVRAELGLLIPLVTRALPLLMIFTVFFFINTEVWQVASALTTGLLWLVVLMFASLAVGFLIARLPEEVERVVVDMRREPDAVREACSGTPVAQACGRILGAAGTGQRTLVADLTRLERTNLVVMLFVVQAVQVLLLALAVWAFFLVFGALAISPDVVESWIGHRPQPPRFSLELAKVATFLAAFSALYFTVYAVSDPAYREQFFTRITTTLERAVGVRAVYRALPGADPTPRGD